MRIAYGSSALYERLATSGTDPWSGTTSLRPSSADTVTLLFVIGSDLCLVVSRIAGLHILVRGCPSLRTSPCPAELLSRLFNSAIEAPCNLGHGSTNHLRPGQTLLAIKHRFR